jgi:hypothetical protein
MSVEELKNPDPKTVVDTKREDEPEDQTEPEPENEPEATTEDAAIAAAEVAKAETVMEDGPKVEVNKAMAPAGEVTVLDKKHETVVDAAPAPFAFRGPFVATGCDVVDSKNVRILRCGTDSNRVMNGPRIAVEAAKAMNKAFP